MDSDQLNRPLRVAYVMGTKAADTDRGPAVIMNPSDARGRLLTDGELAWVRGPRRSELAKVLIDPGAREGDVVLRDIVGASPSEIVRVTKPDLDNTRPRPTAYG